MAKDSRKDIAALVVGVGIEIVFVVLGTQLETMPLGVAIGGYVVGALLNVGGMASLLGAWRFVVRIKLRWPVFLREQEEQVSSIVGPLPSDKIAAFYSTRMSLNRSYGGVQTELENSDEVWAAWHGATIAAHEPANRLKKVSRLLLIHPEWKGLAMYASAPEYRAKPHDLQSDIVFATEAFQKNGTKVKWFDGIFNLITIIDPSTDKARARVEVWFFEETDRRQNYVIDRQENGVAYDAILDTFNKMWNDPLWSHEPPDNLNELRKKLGFGISDSQNQST